MQEHIAFDSHRRHTLAERQEARTGRTRQCRIEHRPGAFCGYLEGCARGTPVAVEATGNCCWIVSEIEQAALVPRLVHPRKAKLMVGMINKTDKLDVAALNRLHRSGTLPTVWIAPGGLRDLRDLTRTRRVHASGGKVRYGQLRPDVNRYLNWAFVQAANVVAMHRHRWPRRHVSRLYTRLRRRKGHAKAVGAVARHLAEASYHVPRRREPHRDPPLGSTRKV